jgi:DUF3040 family protein
MQMEVRHHAGRGTRAAAEVGEVDMLTPQERERLTEIERELAKDAELARLLTSGRPPRHFSLGTAAIVIGYVLGAVLLGIGAVVEQVAPVFLGLLTVAATGIGHLVHGR